ncbi:MAG: histidine kinase [Lachnospiraceae bacterium]|nr:histidine kinase [Lachnospiraceae bacterium]
MQKHQFQRQIAVKSILVVTAVFLVMTAVFSGYIVHTGGKAFEEQVDVQLRGITSQLDNTLRLADNIALQIGANHLIIETFGGIDGYGGKQNYFVDNADRDYALKQHTMSYLLKKNSLSRISLFDEKGNMTYVGRAVDYGYLKKDCPDTQMFEDVAEWFADREHANLFRVDGQDPYVKDPSSTISVFREIKNYQLIPSECLGYVQVQIRFESFSDFEKLLGKDTECYLLPLEGEEILYSLKRERNDEEVQRLLGTKNGFSKDGLYCRMKELPEYGIRVFIISKNSSLIRNLASTLTWVFLLLVCIVSVIFVSQRQIIRKTTEPIVQMCDMLDGLQVDENLQEIPLVAQAEADELQRLNRAFDELVKNLKLSMEKEMLSRVNEIQSRMFALQAQMNPHFIHNILTIISAMAENGEQEKIPEICGMLSSMIRYNTSYETNYGELETEISHAENYLELMKVRYEDKFCYAFNYVGEMRGCRLPRFVVQPLLENCFAHGFRAKKFPWEIDVLVYVSEKYWEINIRDNGNGIEKKKLHALRGELLGMRERDMGELMQEMKIGGLSVRNVYQRLYIAYGEKMVFEIESDETGTSVTVGGETG